MLKLMTKINPYLVVGTGPAAMACCSGLIAAGIKPTVIDIGSTEKFSLSNIINRDKVKIPKRRLNNYMYSSFEAHGDKSFLLESIGFGGLSSVWGGVIRKPTRNHLRDWPITLEDLDQHFNFIDNYFIKKDISEGYENRVLTNIFSESENVLNSSDECSKIIYSKFNSKNIFSTDEIFDKWISEGLIEYFPKIRVKKINRESNFLSVYSSCGDIFYGKKVFLATGAYQSTLIIANSINNDNLALNISENKLIITLWFSLSKKMRKFGVPFFCSANDNEGYYFQFYEFKFSYLKKVLNFIWPVNYLASLIASFVTFSFAYTSQENGFKLLFGYKNNKIQVEENNNKFFPSDLAKIINISKFLLNKKLYIGSRVKNFGFGYHVGSSLPMKKNPREYESDINGSISQFPGLHIVDGAVLSTLPPIPLTYLIMANSLRITKNIISLHEQ
jgi:hypothetical protein